MVKMAVKEFQDNSCKDSTTGLFNAYVTATSIAVTSIANSHRFPLPLIVSSNFENERKCRKGTNLASRADVKYCFFLPGSLRQ